MERPQTRMNPETHDQLRSAISLLQADLAQLHDAQNKLQNRLNALVVKLNEATAAPESASLGSGLIGQAALLAANAYGVPVNILYSQGRDPRPTFPRQLAMYLARECGIPLQSIAAHFGRKDHGTALHACAAVTDRLAVNESFRALVAGYVAQLQASSPFVRPNSPKLSIVK